MVPTRHSRRLQGISPEWKPEVLEDCFFCLSPVTPFTKSAVSLQCCRHFVHRRCQVEWERGNRGTCGYCRGPLHRLFSLVDVSRWSLVRDMQVLVNDDQITRDLQRVSHLVFLLAVFLFFSFFFYNLCSLESRRIVFRSVW